MANPPSLVELRWTKKEVNNMENEIKLGVLKKSDLVHANHQRKGDFVFADAVVRREANGDVRHVWGSGKTEVDAYAKVFHQLLPVPGGSTRLAVNGSVHVEMHVGDKVFSSPLQPTEKGPIDGQVRHGVGRAVYDVFVQASKPK